MDIAPHLPPRLSGETAAEYTAFVAWLRADHAPRGLSSPGRLSGHRPPARSLDRCAEYLAVRPSTLAALHRKFQWETRARRFDLEAAENAVTRRADDIRARAARREALLAESENALALAITAISRAVEGGRPEDLKVLRSLRVDVSKLLATTLAARAEDNAVPEDTGPDLSALSDGELAEYERLTAKARRA